MDERAPDEVDPGNEQFFNIASEILSHGHSLCMRARGISMYPLIRDADLLEIKPIHPDEIRLGDILLYCVGSQSFVHRVVRFCDQDDNRLLLIWGDACPKPDGWIDSRQALGRVLRIQRLGQNISQDSAGQRLLSLLLAGLLPVYKPIHIWFKSHCK